MAYIVVDERVFREENLQKDSVFQSEEGTEGNDSRRKGSKKIPQKDKIQIYLG